MSIESKQSELKNAVAAGLRRMDKQPDALLYVGEENTIVGDKIAGLTVYFSEGVPNTMSTFNTPFIPIWLDDGLYWSDRKRFEDGYIDG